MKSLFNKSILAFSALILSGGFTFAQTEGGIVTAQSSALTNPLFLALLSIIILLLIVIAVLGSVLKNVGETFKENGFDKKNLLGLVILILLLNSKSLSAQEIAENTSNSIYLGLDSFLFYLMLSIILLEIVITMVLISSIKTIVGEKQKSELEESAIAETIKQDNLDTFLDKFNASVPLEKERDVMLDHNYDGIRELDNDLPPWWKYGFYLTIVVAVIYLFNYHIGKTGKLQADEYLAEVEAAKIAKEEYQKKAANLVDENNVTLITDASQLEKAGSIFKDNCAACHGKSAEGGVGPNLTDDYWLHGGTLSSVFKTIKYGVAEKGMKPWESDFSPSQISQLASYIKSLKGSNPANAKAPQGDLFVENNTSKTDSMKTDSATVVPAIIDSTAVSKK